MRGRRRTLSPVLSILILVAIGAATLFGDRVPLLNEVARLLSGLTGGEPQVTGLTGPLTVTRVSDGDTLSAEVGGTAESIRLIGIDTPEKFESAKLTRDDASSPLDAQQIQALGAEASRFTEQLLGDAQIYLEPGAEARDRYGRLLAYVYLPDPAGDFEIGGERFVQVNLELARAGWAEPLTIPPNDAYAADYAAAADEARRDGRGIWGEGWVAAR